MEVNNPIKDLIIDVWPALALIVLIVAGLCFSSVKRSKEERIMLERCAPNPNTYECQLFLAKSVRYRWW